MDQKKNDNLMILKEKIRDLAGSKRDALLNQYELSKNDSKLLS